VSGSGVRIGSLDAIRGFAVMGILLMNVVSMGMPGYAYIDPSFYGGASGADWWAWALAYVFADGKMRMLFTMLFGASLAIVTDAVAQPLRTHSARMAWLLVFGMLHAWFVWYGDILVEYALIGFALYWARAWPPKVLLAVAAGLVILEAGMDLAGGAYAAKLRASAMAPGATAAAREAWQAMLSDLRPPDETITAELRGYRGGLADAFAARIPMTILFQTVFMPITIIGTTGIAAFGLALYRLGFLSGDWSARAYWRFVAAGVAAVIAYVPLVAWVSASRWDPVLLPVTDTLSLILRPFVALGYAAALILLLRSGRLRWLTDRLEAAGKAAFTNYLGTSLVATTIFYGYGLGWFGHLSRWQLYLVVALIWLLILLWSKPWLTRFRYGPLEWLWRSLARGAVQPLRSA